MGVYYKRTHKIAGINFLPRLTLAEYNNLTVKPEHWIRTDSPFNYSKTDVPKLTLAQYQDLAIKPKFWIRTDAPESYTHMSATQVDMTDSVSVFDYLDDLNAEQVAYDSSNSVKDKIDEVDDKTFAEMSSIGITDANDLPNGIFYNTVLNIANLPSANRFLIISVQVLDTPVRKLQWAFALDGSAYQRLKQGDTWGNWQLKIVAN